MSKNEYQMTTVYKYLELLDKDLKPEEKKISLNAERYLLDLRRSRKNADILEKLLA